MPTNLLAPVSPLDHTTLTFLLIANKKKQKNMFIDF